jgi:hypothetical protein
MSLSQLVKRLQRRGQVVHTTTPDEGPDQTHHATPLNPVKPPTEVAAKSVSWRILDAAYLAHHVNCITCQAAGRGANYGLRCRVGSALWFDYDVATMQPACTRQRGFAGRP